MLNVHWKSFARAAFTPHSENDWRSAHRLAFGLCSLIADQWQSDLVLHCPNLYSVSEVPAFIEELSSYKYDEPVRAMRLTLPFESEMARSKSELCAYWLNASKQLQEDLELEYHNLRGSETTVTRPTDVELNPRFQNGQLWVDGGLVDKPHSNATNILAAYEAFEECGWDGKTVYIEKLGDAQQIHNLVTELNKRHKKAKTPLEFYSDSAKAGGINFRFKDLRDVP